MRLRLCLLILSILSTSLGYSWNALGHRLVAQIAYQHLTKSTKERCNYYNHALDKSYKPMNLINAAVWLDSLHEEKDLELQQKHYISLPFSSDGSYLRPPNKVNALSAIEDAQAVMKNKFASDFEKGFSLRILLHVVADIHQPMHAVSQYTARHPEGDRGGNLFYLKANPVATNLHAYWDRGGGYLLKKKGSYSKAQLARKARRISKRWPCEFSAIDLEPRNWAQESHQLAVSKAYQLKKGKKPNRDYQRMVKALTEQRLALAGCRLAAVLIALN